MKRTSPVTLFNNKNMRTKKKNSSYCNLNSNKRKTVTAVIKFKEYDKKVVLMLLDNVSRDDKSI